MLVLPGLPTSKIKATAGATPAQEAGASGVVPPWSCPLRALEGQGQRGEACPPRHPADSLTATKGPAGRSHSPGPLHGLSPL